MFHSNKQLAHVLSRVLVGLLVLLVLERDDLQLDVAWSVAPGQRYCNRMEKCWSSPAVRITGKLPRGRLGQQSVRSKRSNV
jgi:predicted proteasome-type protease